MANTGRVREKLPPQSNVHLQQLINFFLVKPIMYSKFSDIRAREGVSRLANANQKAEIHASTCHMTA